MEGPLDGAVRRPHQPSGLIEGDRHVRQVQGFAQRSGQAFQHQLRIVAGLKTDDLLDQLVGVVARAVDPVGDRGPKPSVEPGQHQRGSGAEQEVGQFGAGRVAEKQQAQDVDTSDRGGQPCCEQGPAQHDADVEQLVPQDRHGDRHWHDEEDQGAELSRDHRFANDQARQLNTNEVGSERDQQADDDQCHPWPVIGAARAQVRPRDQHDDCEGGVSLRYQPDAGQPLRLLKPVVCRRQRRGQVRAVHQERGSVQRGHYPPLPSKDGRRLGEHQREVRDHRAPDEGPHAAGNKLWPQRPRRECQAQHRSSEGPVGQAEGCHCRNRKHHASCGVLRPGHHHCDGNQDEDELDEQRRGAVAEDTSPAVCRQGHLDRLRLSVTGYAVAELVADLELLPSMGRDPVGQRDAVDGNDSVAVLKFARGVEHGVQHHAVAPLALWVDRCADPRVVPRETRLGEREPRDPGHGQARQQQRCDCRPAPQGRRARSPIAIRLLGWLQHSHVFIVLRLRP